MTNPQSVHPPEQDEANKKNQFREDFRQRLDLFIKSVLAFAAGALTISMTHFLKTENASLTAALLSDLQLAWGLLLYTIIAFSLSQFVMVLQGRSVIAKWENNVQLSYEEITRSKAMQQIRKGILILGASGFITFILGLITLGIVTIGAVEIAAG